MTIELAVLILVGSSNAATFGALVFFLNRVRAPIQVTVPPPVALVPIEWARVLERIAADDPWAILKRLDERVTPPPRPSLDPAQAEVIISNIIREARLAADQMALLNERNGHKTNGADKQREAIRHITQRLAPLGLVLDYNTISMRLEAEVAGAKEKTPS